MKRLKKEEIADMPLGTEPIGDIPPPADPHSGRRPTLVRCGNHFINPEDVSSIKEVKTGLWMVKFRAEPNPEYPTWLKTHEVRGLLSFFDVQSVD